LNYLLSILPVEGRRSSQPKKWHPFYHCVSWSAKVM